VYPEGWWATTFARAVAEFGHTVLVLTPWDDPVPLKRSWCLWEILSSLESGARLDIRLHAREKERFAQALRRNDDSVLTNMSRIDVAKAEAWSQEDQANILAAVHETEGGVSGVNAVIQAKMRDWLAQSGRELGRGGTKEDLDDTYRVAGLLSGQGKLEEAEGLYRRALEGYRAHLGPTDPLTIICTNTLATVLNDQGKSEEGAPLQRAALEGLESRLGPRHPETLTAYNNMGLLLWKLQELEEAERMYRQALEGREAVLGPAVMETLNVVSNLAVLLRKKGVMDEAMPLMHRALEGYEAVLGPAHPKVADSHYNLAQFYEDSDCAVSAKHMKLAVEKYEQCYGRGHSKTETARGLADLYAMLAQSGVKGLGGG